MRQRELLALKWQVVDSENSRPSVRRTVTVSEGRILLGEPKTEKSRRTIQLARRIERVERLGDFHKDQGIVFASKLGSSTNPTDARAQVRMGASTSCRVTKGFAMLDGDAGAKSGA